VLCPEEMGGILKRRGALDLPAILYERGDPHGGGGIFIVAANPDDYSREVMISKGLFANSTREAMLVYRPHHLCGAETGMSILCAGLLGVPTGSSELRQNVDIIATATRDFRRGEVLSAPGESGWDRDFRAKLQPGAAVGLDSPLPFFMLESNRLAVDVPAGTLITKEMLVPPQDSVLWSLREQQDTLFFKCE